MEIFRKQADRSHRRKSSPLLLEALATVMADEIPYQHHAGLQPKVVVHGAHPLRIPLVAGDEDIGCGRVNRVRH